MIDSLCTRFGTPLVENVYAFPSLEQLRQNATEVALREMGFGYRAPYLMSAVEYVHSKGGTRFLHELRTKTLDECRAELTQIRGVGLKVADCVALFSLDQRGCVPVDTHVWQVAMSAKYASRVVCGGGGKSLTPNMYKRISAAFSQLWGAEAGWAHTFVFNERISGK